MARAAVLASGNGSNFQALAEAVDSTGHRITSLICDRKDAGCFSRARALGIPFHHISYYKRSKEEAENEILSVIREEKCDFLFLAGFMRLISPLLLDGFEKPIINIHPALLPKYPGTHGIEESYESRDRELGITIHQVDYGMDTGPILCQKSFIRTGGESLSEIEEQIHALEHIWYPETAIRLLDQCGGNSL